MTTYYLSYKKNKPIPFKNFAEINHFLNTQFNTDIYNKHCKVYPSKNNSIDYSFTTKLFPIPTIKYKPYRSKLLSKDDYENTFPLSESETSNDDILDEYALSICDYHYNHSSKYDLYESDEELDDHEEMY